MTDPLDVPLLGCTRETCETIYAAYPKHVGKQAALNAIARALKDVPAALLLAKVREYAASPAGQAGQWVPDPANWFRAGRWDDDVREWHRQREVDRHAKMVPKPTMASRLPPAADVAAEQRAADQKRAAARKRNDQRFQGVPV